MIRAEPATGHGRPLTVTSTTTTHRHTMIARATRTHVPWARYCWEYARTGSLSTDAGAGLVQLRVAGQIDRSASATTGLKAPSGKKYTCLPVLVSSPTVFPIPSRSSRRCCRRSSGTPRSCRRPDAASGSRRTGRRRRRSYRRRSRGTPSVPARGYRPQRPRSTRRRRWTVAQASCPLRWAKE